MFLHSSLTDGVLPAVSRNHPADIARHTFARKILIVHHDFSHPVHLDHRLRLKRAFPVSGGKREKLAPRFTFLINAREFSRVIYISETAIISHSRFRFLLYLRNTINLLHRLYIISRVS